MLATAPDLRYCDRCGAARTHHGRGLCRECFEDRRGYRAPQPIVCLNCELEAPNRGRGLCPRCYQYAYRTGRMPAPNHTTVEEVWSDDDA